MVHQQQIVNVQLVHLVIIQVQVQKNVLNVILSAEVTVLHQQVNVTNVLKVMVFQVELVQHVDLENIQQEEQELVYHVQRLVIHQGVNQHQENVMVVMQVIISLQVLENVQLVEH